MDLLTAISQFMLWMNWKFRNSTKRRLHSTADSVYTGERKERVDMDQTKVGRFIAECRKEKSMTQRQLADEIGVSDKTISKWETGRGLPEAAYMVPLCETLEINVNELLTGEKISDEEYQNKAEETMVALAEMRAEVDEVKQKVISMNKGVEIGVTFGNVLAAIISYHAYTSIGWAILHGLLGWIYVIYYVMKY